MSVCNTCYNGGTIPSCVASIQFGTVEVDTTYNLWIQNNATQAIRGASVESDSSGVVSFDDFLIDPRSAYTLWLTADTESPNQTRIDITVGEDIYTSICFDVVKSFDSLDVVASLTE
jgi:hypothetical protein